VGQLGQDRASSVRSSLDQKAVFFLAEHLREREIEAGFGLGAGIHRNTEAGSTGNRAVYRDDECILAPCAVMRIDLCALQKDLILYGDRVEIAGADSNESETLVRIRFWDNTPPARIAFSAPQAQHWRVQKLLP